MATYKRTGPDGLDYAYPSKRPCPPPPPKPPMKPGCGCDNCNPPPPPPEPCPDDWAVYPYYPPYQDLNEPVPCPPMLNRPHYPMCPPPYGMPQPEKIDESSKRLAKLSQKARVLVQMIKDFEQKNKPAILTIGNNSYQFGTEYVIDPDGESTTGMYANVICGDPIEELNPDGYGKKGYETDESGTRVTLRNAKDLLQSELARVRTEITLVAAALHDEVLPDADAIKTEPTYVFGTDEKPDNS